MTVLPGLMFLTLTLFVLAADICFAAPAAAAAGAENDEIASKLATDKFVAAKLADAIIESGKSGELLKTAASDRSDLRMQVIGWIQSNPSTAARLYRAGQDLPDGQTEYVLTGAHQVTKIRSMLTPEFLRITNGFISRAKNAKTPEQLAAAGDELFLGRHSSGATGAGGSESSSSVPGADGFRRNQQALDIPALNWRMNPASISRETASAATALEQLEKELTLDRAIAAKRLSGSAATPQQIAENLKTRQEALGTTRGGQTVRQQVAGLFAAREKQLETTIQAFKTFQNYLGQFVSRKQINAEESALLEQLRQEMRLGIARLQITTHIAHLQRDNAETVLLTPALLRTAGLPEQTAQAYSAAGPGLTAESNRLLEEYALILKLADAGKLPLPQLYSRVYALSASEAAWRTKWLIFVSLPDMARTAAKLRPQPKFDSLAQKLFSKQYPASPYMVMQNNLATYRKAVTAAIAAVERGDFNYALSLFAAAEGGTPADGLNSVARQIACSRDFINRTRDRAELFQAAFFEGPFFRPAAPLFRRGLGLISRAAASLSGL